jgi:hypothetical protein
VTIEEFAQRHAASVRPIEQVVDDWVADKRRQDQAHASVFAASIGTDLVNGGSLLDALPEEARQGFAQLMGDKADSLLEIKRMFAEKDGLGAASLRGFKNKIQGQIGENIFRSAAGSGARLAESGSQRGWDVAIPDGVATRYVQVKIHEDACSVIEKMREVDSDIRAELVRDGETLVTSVDFAVNDDVFDEVKKRVAELGLTVDVVKVGATQDEIRQYLDAAHENLVAAPIENFFTQLLGGVAATTTLHAAINGFLLWKGAQERAQAVEDTVYGSAISTGGWLAGQLLEAAVLLGELDTVAAVLASPDGGVFTVGLSMYVRGMLRRFADRRHCVARLEKGNASLRVLSSSFLEKWTDPTAFASLQDSRRTVQSTANAPSRER